MSSELPPQDGRAQLWFDGRRCTFEPGDSVLQCLQRHAVPVAASCYDGICGVCTVRSEGGPSPEGGQGSLRSAQRELGFLLACRSRAQPGQVLMPRNHRCPVPAVVTELSQEGAIKQVSLRAARPIAARPGQLLAVRVGGLARNGERSGVRCHQRGLPITARPNRATVRVALVGDQGAELAESSPGASLLIEDWQGECFYVANPEEDLWLLGSGLGAFLCHLAVLKQASARGHTGRISLVSDAGAPLPGWAKDRISRELDDSLDLLLSEEIPPVASAGVTPRIYLSGPRGFLRSARKRVLSAGGTSNSLHVQELPAPRGSGLTNRGPGLD